MGPHGQSTLDRARETRYTKMILLVIPQRKKKGLSEKATPGRLFDYLNP